LFSKFTAGREKATRLITITTAARETSRVATAYELWFAVPAIELMFTTLTAKLTTDQNPNTQALHGIKQPGNGKFR
jgi:hypothetical protein